MHGGEWLLTEAGERLLLLAERAEAAMLDIEETQQDEDMSGFVRVAVSESFGIWFLSERIKAFHDAYPSIVVELISPSWRSEEHTSELQSLMRTSYAVFCLKKNNST